MLEITPITKSKIKRKEELCQKITSLLLKYDDVPIVVLQNVHLKEKKGEAILDLDSKHDTRLVKVMIGCKADGKIPHDYLKQF